MCVRRASTPPNLLVKLSHETHSGYLVWTRLRFAWGAFRALAAGACLRHRAGRGQQDVRLGYVRSTDAGATDRQYRQSHGRWDGEDALRGMARVAVVLIGRTPGDRDARVRWRRTRSAPSFETQDPRRRECE